ncbi:MAG: hypothetical protein EOO65_02870 [Methanosarcinales archaeon]|nr:MAG: hypothetical protein EOO65_02870 [Methanosarcinales archaeon]
MQSTDADAVSERGDAASTCVARSLVYDDDEVTFSTLPGTHSASDDRTVRDMDTPPVPADPVVSTTALGKMQPRQRRLLKGVTSETGILNKVDASEARQIAPPPDAALMHSRGARTSGSALVMAPCDPYFARSLSGPNQVDDMEADTEQALLSAAAVQGTAAVPSTTSDEGSEVGASVTAPVHEAPSTQLQVPPGSAADRVTDENSVCVQRVPASKLPPKEPRRTLRMLIQSAALQL